MSGNANVDTPKSMTKTELDDKYIREFDRMIVETREFMRDYNERRRLRGLSWKVLRIKNKKQYLDQTVRCTRGWMNGTTHQKQTRQIYGLVFLPYS